MFQMLTIASTIREYCVREVMNASCPENHMILMASAYYGRMRMGRCILTDVYIGCSMDALRHLDERCSGRQQCTVPLPDYDLQDHPLHTCPPDMHSYLEASFECIGGDSVLALSDKEVSLCAHGHAIELSSAGGYIPSSLNTSGCALRVHAPRGKFVRLYLYEFTNHGPRSMQNEPTGVGKAGKHSRCGDMPEYAIIREGRDTYEHMICGSRDRLSIVYTSRTSDIDIFFKQGTNKFLIKYLALGCEDPPAPFDGMVYRHGDLVTFTCNTTAERWDLECRGNDWVGTRKNCTIPTEVEFRLPVNTWYVPTEAQSIHSYGILVAIFVGVTVGALLGFVLLAFVLVCRRVFRNESRSDQEASATLKNSAPNSATYGVFAAPPHRTVQHLDQNRYTHIWKLQCPNEEHPPDCQCSMQHNAPVNCGLVQDPYEGGTLRTCSVHSYESANCHSMICRGSPAFMETLRNGQESTRLCVKPAVSSTLGNPSEDYTLAMSSDYVEEGGKPENNDVIEILKNNKGRVVSTSVTYVCKPNKDYDKVPKIVHNSPSSTVITNENVTCK